MAQAAEVVVELEPCACPHCGRHLCKAAKVLGFFAVLPCPRCKSRVLIRADAGRFVSVVVPRGVAEGLTA